MHARSTEGCTLPDCACGRHDESERQPQTTAKERRDWRASQQFESWVRRELAAEGVEFREWLVLEALSEIQDPSKDGVYQVEVARHVGASERVVAYWMAVLDHKAWVDRGPGEDPRHWAVLLTDLGEQALVRCREQLARAQKAKRRAP